MATDAASLISAASCFTCYAPNSYTARLMELVLLQQIVLQGNPMADTSPQTLLANAKCFECNGATPYMLQLMELSLLQQIVNNGGGGGGGGTGLTCGDYGGTQPNFVPASGCGAAVDTSNGRFWLYYSGQWN